MTYNVGNSLAEPGRLTRLPRYAAVDLVGLQELAASQAEILTVELAGAAPSALLADFNMTSRNPVYARFVAAGLEDAFAASEHDRSATRIGQDEHKGNARMFDQSLDQTRMRLADAFDTEPT